MLPASNRGAGMNMGFPDVCLTPAPPAPPIPVPYPNIAMNAQAVGFAPTVMVSMMNALNIGTRIAMSSGDEAGVAHPTIKGGSGYVMGNPIVSINKLPAINLTCPTNSNNMNDAVGAVLVPSAVNVTYAFAGADGELEALGDRITSGDPGRPAVEHTLLEEGVGYLAVRLVTRDLAARVSAARRALGAEGARGLLLDLRGNPGGDVAAALATASLFVPAGTPLARWMEPDGDERTERARGSGDTHTPLVVLVDEHTASSAELLASCWQCSGRALLVGGSTFGKGVATTARGELAAELRLPNGAPWHGVGLRPDLPVAAGLQPDGTDPRLQAALLLLRALLERAR